MDVIEVAPRLHWFKFAVGHAYLWQDDDGLMLIDSGQPGSAAPIAEAIRDLGYQTADVRRLFLTHFHGDHVGGAAEITTWGDVAVYAHRDDAPMIRGEAEGPPPVLLDWERELLAQVRAGMSADPVPPVPVDHLLYGDEVLENEAHALAVPGHTPGSAALYLPGPRILFTGDTIARTEAGEVIPGVFNVDRAQAIASFRRLSRLEVAIACFGHGDPLTENTTAKLRAAVDVSTS
jgi:glyoxylase-like metal-dependent hydrolase (beta-lactamase superfamily II)